MNNGFNILTFISSIVASVVVSLAAPYLLDRGYSLLHKGKDRYKAKKDALQFFCGNTQIVLSHYKHATAYLSDCYVQCSGENREECYFTFQRVEDVESVNPKYDIGIGINNKSRCGFTIEKFYSTGREITLGAKEPKYIDVNEAQVFLFQSKDRPTEITAKHLDHFPQYKLEPNFSGWLSPYRVRSKYNHKNG